MFELSPSFLNSPAELFGAAALIIHLYAYALYAREIFHERIRPNVSSWLMWLFGGVVEYITYDAIPGSTWASNALPIACVLGIGFITLAIGVAQARNFIAKTKYAYHSPTKLDYTLVSFDIGAAIFWLMGGDPLIANMLAVGTSFITFVPIWRTTYHDPAGENHWPWLWWSLAYAFMFLAVLTGPSKAEYGLYFFPVYYFLLHIIIVVLSRRKA